VLAITLHRILGNRDERAPEIGTGVAALLFERGETAFSSPLRGGERPLDYRTRRAPHAPRFVLWDAFGSHHLVRIATIGVDFCRARTRTEEGAT